MVELESLAQCVLCGSRALVVVDEECNLTRCQDCGYVFDNPRPVLAELIKFYSRPTQYDGWLHQLEQRKAMWKRRLKIMLPFRKKGSLLDIGTGIGQFLAIARPYYDGVFGTEVSATAIRIAHETYGLELFRGTIEEFQSMGKVFDNIALFHVLEHVPDPAAVIRTCHSLLSNQGVLVVAVPNEVLSLRNWRRRKLVALSMRKPHPGAGKFCIQPIRLTGEGGEVHLSHFTPRVLEKLLRRYGFHVLRNTPDPHYLISSKKRKLREDLYFSMCVAVEKIFGMNIYDAILVIAKKTSALSEQQMAA